MVDYWGIHNDRIDIDPLADNAVRVGWDEMPDLRTLDATRDAFRKAVADAYPDEHKSHAASAGTLYRFVHEMSDGDIVVSPNRADRTLRIGRICGPYEYRPETPYQHWRPVQWLIPRISRDELSEAAQNELSSATTLFRIQTARPELEHLLDHGRPVTGKADFTWVPFYTELADKLVPFRDRRGDLLDILWDAAGRSGAERLFRYLKTDHRLDGTIGALTDIDPFTVYGPFNRGITDSRRTRIAEAYRDAFGIAAPAPTRFDGIPVVDNRNSWFIRWEIDRADDAVDRLWDLFEAAKAYAESRGETNRERLITAFDGAATGQTRMLTMGTYWVRPETFTAFDGVNSRFLANAYPEIAAHLNLGGKISGEDFLVNTETVTSWLSSSSSPFATPPELSRSAWLYQGTAGSSSATATDGSATPSESTATGGPVNVSDVADGYTVADIVADGSFLDVQLLESMIEAVKSKKNIILQGPPGTGKTWLARRLGWVLCDERGSKRTTLLQFHPSMSYEDFVRGFRPGSDGTLTLVDGPLLTAADKARKDPGNDYVLVIEEINRGNPAQIFGEMLTLLEHDKRHPDSALNLAYPREGEGPFHLPENLHVIGTMNVADRSLALVDMALRRRFAFFDLQPEFNDAWREFVTGRGYDDAVVDHIAERMTALNDVIAADPNLGKDYGIGHSYFTPGSVAEAGEHFSEKWFQRVVRFEIAPLLAEYWFDKPQQVQDQLRILQKPSDRPS
ncbi:MAG: AAA family ATPase [Rhodococcus sp. (in: high G+C Gram-positive bacteria)]|uniref:AAA family ATPase n=1 Tax=Rhodococcus sp. TaxID=1831 RepID=UPI003BB6CAB2